MRPVVSARPVGAPSETSQQERNHAVSSRIRCVPLCCLALVLSTRAVADESEWKLQPLKYDNPGLEVDLGVGLWAFPLPLDYDDDGDIDLLVGCPDKPSRGTYFFENPSQDPHLAMPVFKAGVRIGPGFHFMMLSRIGDESVVLTPGREFRRDPTSGRFDFDKGTRIDAPANPHTAGRRTRGNMWRYVDIDADGDHDIAVGIGDWSEYAWDHAYDSRGEWRNGPLHGYVYLLTNEGSDEKPRYAKTPQRLRAGGGDIDVYGWPSPDFADFDGDGDLDLVCGEFLDGLTYFENIGSRTEPTWAAGVRLRTADGRLLALHVQMITPTAIDQDADGDTDLVVGDEDGRVAFVENTGDLRDGVPVFKPPQYFRQQADTLKFGALATPYAYDWDQDGDEDILCGNTAGSIGLFENLGKGERGLPRWSAPKLLQVRAKDGSTRPFRVLAGPSGSIQGPCEAKWGYTTLSVADYDGDGDGDIVYNSIQARLGLLLNDSGTLVERPFDTGLRELPPPWYWWQRPSSAALTQWRTTPLATDFDGDGKLDLVLLDQEGYLTLRRGGKSAERIFVDEDLRPLQLNSASCGRSGRVKLAVVDWDGDSRLDILVNSENAAWYRNCATRDGRTVLKRVGNLARRNVSGHTSSPAVCDFDADGKPDLLVGSENGRIYYLAHEDCVQFSAEQLEARAPMDEKGHKLAAMVKSEQVFVRPPTRQCHASTICATTRGLVAAWFGGSKEGHRDVGIWSSYHDGRSWSRPIEIADGVQHGDSERGGVGEGSRRHPCWNPILYQPPGDAPTWLFFKVGRSPRAWWGEMMLSYDRGRSFVERRRLPENIDGPVRAKPMLLDDGVTLLCGSSTEHSGWRVHFETLGIAQGLPRAPWGRVGPLEDPSDLQAIQPTLLRHADGRIQALCRTQRSVVASTRSTDQGRTWSPLQRLDLPNPNSGIEALSLRDGRHLLVYNPLDAGASGWGSRSVLSLAISTDGEEWRAAGDLEREAEGEFSYPAMIQAPDGSVHITYTWKRSHIRHVVLDPEKLESP